MSIFDEPLEIYCVETQEQFNIYAYDDESFDKEIKNMEG